MILLLTITTKRRFPSHDYTGGFLGVDHPPTLTNWTGLDSNLRENSWFLIPIHRPWRHLRLCHRRRPLGRFHVFCCFLEEKTHSKKKKTSGTMWNQFVEFNWCWRVVQWLYLFHHEQFKQRFCSRNHVWWWWFTSPGNRQFTGIPSQKSRSMDCPSELNLKKRFEDVPSVLPEAIFDSV